MDADLAQLKRDFLQLVLAKGYERRDQPFPLSSGGQSHDYVDMRRTVASGRDLKLAAAVLAASLSAVGLEWQVIGGMTMGADPVAHALALTTEKSWYSVRKATKTHGREQRIEGAAVGPGIKTVVMEDTVSTGKSLFDAYDVVTETGADVVAVCTLLDRGDAVAARFRELGVPYVAVLTYEDLGIEPLGA